MACLGAITYDPTTRVSISTNTLSAMTALDSTNARITFTAPSNGSVLVRLRVAERGGAMSMNLLGVLNNSAAVIGRVAPWIARGPASASGHHIKQAAFVVTGLTPGNTYIWDAAYATQVIAAVNLSWGGPNDATGNDAAGALVFEVWETTNLLAATLFDPSTASTWSVATLTAMTALDITNLRLNFTVPASGRVLVNMRCVATGGGTGTPPSMLFGVMEGSTVKGRAIAAYQSSQIGTAAATDHHTYDTSFIVSGLTPAASLNWDAAMGVQAVLASENLTCGGPNNATGNNAWGGFVYDIWAA